MIDCGNCTIKSFDHRFPDHRLICTPPAVGMAKMNFSPSRLTFFHCDGFPGSGPGSLNSSFAVPAVNVGAVLMSTAMTSQSRVMKYISLLSCRQNTMPMAPFLDTCTGEPGGGASGLFASNART